MLYGVALLRYIAKWQEEFHITVRLQAGNRTSVSFRKQRWYSDVPCTMPFWQSSAYHANKQLWQVRSIETGKTHSSIRNTKFSWIAYQTNYRRWNKLINNGFDCSMLGYDPCLSQTDSTYVDPRKPGERRGREDGGGRGQARVIIRRSIH